MNQNKQVLTFIEVAEMVGRAHNEVLKDIRQIIEDLGMGNFPFSSESIDIKDFFEESKYRSMQNKKLPCFLVTKEGCEVYGNRMTGVKGTQFTFRYVNRFNKMEQQLKEQNLPMSLDEKIATIASGYGNMHQEIGDVKEKVEDLSERFGLPATNAAILSHVRNGHIVHYLGGKDKKAYQKLSRKVFSEFGRDFKENFEVPRYDATPLSQFDEALTYTKSWQPSFNTREAIRKLNLLG
ncbi:ORF6C domain-containing protein [Lactococcus sp. S64]|uniref:Rha family transcriptional regulator n=1 Tax=Lactococcus sp. S64 TaxID=2767459 RepID=UPI001906B9E6|nr:Rha family transcriptional regulator [Lactococcus sp. S64]MBK0084381.1 ORF6C domain-containing protein [Lactococcus sp. S64]